MKLIKSILVLCCFYMAPVFAQLPGKDAIISLIPVPGTLVKQPGSLTLGKEVVYNCINTDLEKGFEVFQNKLIKDLKINCRKASSAVNIRILESYVVPDEGYQLSITPKEIIIRAKNAAGVFYATQTLLQLLPEGVYSSPANLRLPLVLPCLYIEDNPRFSYRGMHLDVCRHFFPVEFIKKYIDLIAMHKMNRFHWHLTEDQGWRIEIKKYPKLTEVGSIRKETLIGNYADVPHKYDGQAYGGYYTQAQIKEIVKYAANRFVTIVPEIELPGHSLAALAAYPELGCTGGPYEVATTWGVFEDVYCPYEKTFQFLEGVLTEVMELFPGQLIHIGGDECPKESWKKSSFCQNLMKEKGLKNEEELQSYFIKRIATFIESKGKRVIGWDEILEGGLADNVAVMSWRGIKGGIEAAEQGHDVVMTPGSHCYFDHYQSLSQQEPNAIGGFTSVKKVYNYEPVPEELSKEKAKHILGAQGNVWTEYIESPEQVEYMAMPRMCALSEVLWSEKINRNEQGFISRLKMHTKRLQAMQVNYAKHIYDPDFKTNTSSDGNLSVELTPSSSGDQLVISMDGKNFAPYSKPISLTSTGSLSFKNSMPGSNTSRLDFIKSLSTGSLTTSSILPDKRYPGSNGTMSLTDGLKGGRRFNGQDWCAWQGKDIELVIDMKYPKEISSMLIGSLLNKGAWIYLPKSASIECSTNGIEFLKLITNPMDFQGKKAEMKFNKINARYLKLKLTAQGKIPAGEQGSGQDAWLFIDEIEVY